MTKEQPSESMIVYEILFMTDKFNEIFFHEFQFIWHSRFLTILLILM